MLIEHGVYTLAALGADRDAADIKAALEAKQEVLRAAKRGRDASAEMVIAAGALTLAAEVDVEVAVRKVESRTLEVVKKKREQEPYARLFPGNLAQALTPTGRAQAAVGTRVESFFKPAKKAKKTASPNRGDTPGDGPTS